MTPNTHRHRRSRTSIVPGKSMTCVNIENHSLLIVQQRGQSLVNWGSDDIKTIFMTAASNTTSNGSNTSSTSANTTSSSATTTKSQTSGGAIAGGVIGGLAVLAIAGTLILLFVKKRRNDQLSKENRRTSIEQRHHQPDMQNISMGWKSEMPADPAASEMPACTPFLVHELPSSASQGTLQIQRPIHPYEMP